MKVAVILIVAMVMVMVQEADSWRFWRDTVKPLVHRVPGVPTVNNGIRKARKWIRRWGKRQTEDPDFDAAYNAAADDGVFSDEEIKSVFGADVAEFKEIYDMNDDGAVQVSEYEIVSALAANTDPDAV